MSKYILITATDWDIYTDKFDTFDDARSKMMGELKKELVRSGAMYELTDVLTEGGFPDTYILPDVAALERERLYFHNLSISF